MLPLCLVNKVEYILYNTIAKIQRWLQQNWPTRKNSDVDITNTKRALDLHAHGMEMAFNHLIPSSSYRHQAAMCRSDVFTAIDHTHVNSPSQLPYVAPPLTDRPGRVPLSDIKRQATKQFY